MIDQHLGQLTNAEVRTMAERMQSSQQRDIQELEGKLSEPLTNPRFQQR